MVLDLFFDEHGEQRDAASPSLRRSLDAAESGFDFRRFMIVNAGWVSVVRADKDLVLALRPAKVSPKAFAGALFFLADQRDLPATLEVHDGTRQTRYPFASIGALVSAACEIAAQAQDAGVDRFRRRAASREAARKAPLAVELVRIWRELDGVLDMERMWRLLNKGFGGRYIVISPSRSGFEVDAMGAGFSELARYWRSKNGRVRVVDQPDVRYGRWVSNAYEDALNWGAPLVEQVDCDIEWPQEGTRRHCYWRVIAPFRSAAGSPALLSVSLPDSGISLRR